jgi:hypothetical protein
MNLAPELFRMSVFVDLTDEVVKKAFQLGKARCDEKELDIRQRQSGYHNNPLREYPHQIGVIGEYAFAQFSGRKVDETLLALGDKGDFGEEIEIKTSTHNNPMLLIKQEEYNRKSPKRYVLVRVDEQNLNRVELVGQISREDFQKNKWCEFWA